MDTKPTMPGEGDTTDTSAAPATPQPPQTPPAGAGQLPPQRRRPTVGMRTIKTATAAALCALIYYFLDRSPAFACIGAIFGLGTNMEHSKLNGGNRLFGTAIGGVIGMVMFRIYLIFHPEGGRSLLLVVLVFIGTRAVSGVLGGRCAARRRGALHIAVQHAGGYLHQLRPQPYF